MVIALEGMKFHALLGLNPEEKILGNEIVVDVYVTVKPGKAGGNNIDDIGSTLDYVKIYEAVRYVLSEEMNLLEAACDKILSAVRSLSNEINHVRVRVAKVNPPISGRVYQTYIENEWVRPA